MGRTRILDVERDHLVHLLPRIEVCGCTSMIAELALHTGATYRHTLMFEELPESTPPETLYYLQAAGCELRWVDRITPELLESGGYTGAVLYNTDERMAELAPVLPSVTYAYGQWCSRVNTRLYVACSEYAAHHTLRNGDPATMPSDTQIVPPLINTRALRNVPRPSGIFTVGVLTSGYAGKYPSNLVLALLSQVPEDTRLLLSGLPTYPHPGVKLALDEAIRKYRGRVVLCPVKPTASTHYMRFCHAVVCASSSSHFEPYGRLAAEAMAAGRPVLCERRGCYPHMYEDGIDVLFFDGIGELLDHLDRIRHNENVCTTLGTNAQLRASWEDVTVHLGKFKRTLRATGS